MKMAVCCLRMFLASGPKPEEASLKFPRKTIVRTYRNILIWPNWDRKNAVGAASILHSAILIQPTLQHVACLPSHTKRGQLVTTLVLII